MQTRFTSLVKLKKNTMQKSEQHLQNVNATLKRASQALESSYSSLEEIELPKTGSMAQMLASRVLMHSQREIINHNKEWVSFAQNEVQEARKQLKLDMMEHEKIKYLELQEIKKALDKKRRQEEKDLDEIALMAYNGKKR